VHQFLQDYYAKLSNLAIVARSSRKAIGKALELEFGANQMNASSYLILCLCFKEYCHATNLAVRLFKTSEFEKISDHYNRLATQHSDQQLLIFSGDEVQSILERVGTCLRPIVCGTEAIDRTTLLNGE
jgi:hypothetical protein